MHDILHAEVRTPMLEIILFVCQGAICIFTVTSIGFMPCVHRMEVEIFWELPRHQNFWCREMGMDQYLLIPFLGGWTSINPSYFDVHQGYKVLTHFQMIHKKKQPIVIKTQ